MDRKWWIALGTAIIVVPLLVFFRDNLTWVFAESRPKITSIEEAVVKQTETQATLTELYQEQRQKNDFQDVEMKAQKEVTAAQVDALKSIVERLKR